MPRWPMIALLLLSSGFLSAQDAAPVVKFSLDFPDSPPPEAYALTLDARGEAHYRSWNHDDGDAYETRFIASDALRARVFQLAKTANYFQGDFDYRKHRIAFTGNKTLAWQEGERQSETHYNWSENAAVDELTRIFTGISNTLECAPRLQHLRRFDKLGLEAELKGMEEMQKSGFLREIHVIAPQLEAIAADASVLNVARQRARRLLQAARSESAALRPPEAAPAYVK